MLLFVFSLNSLRVFADLLKLFELSAINVHAFAESFCCFNRQLHPHLWWNYKDFPFLLIGLSLHWIAQHKPRILLQFCWQCLIGVRQCVRHFRCTRLFNLNRHWSENAGGNFAVSVLIAAVLISFESDWLFFSFLFGVFVPCLRFGLQIYSWCYLLLS